MFKFKANSNFDKSTSTGRNIGVTILCEPGQYKQNHKQKTTEKLSCFMLLLLSYNRLFAVGGHVTTATLNQSAMTKWHPEMEKGGLL